MTYNDIRKAFLEYFQSKGHKIVPSASLIPNDPTLLFTVAGMVPWKNILQGTEPAFAPRVADVQKCIRAGGKHNDLEDVGFDGRHHTFFEMLGNWSFGDYFKEGAIEMSWELLTQVFGLDPNRIVVTTHYSDDEAVKTRFCWVTKITGGRQAILDHVDHVQKCTMIWGQICQVGCQVPQTKMVADGLKSGTMYLCSITGTQMVI